MHLRLPRASFLHLRLPYASYVPLVPGAEAQEAHIFASVPGAEAQEAHVFASVPGAEAQEAHIGCIGEVQRQKVCTSEA